MADADETLDANVLLDALLALPSQVCHRLEVETNIYRIAHVDDAQPALPTPPHSESRTMCTHCSLPTRVRALISTQLLARFARFLLYDVSDTRLPITTQSTRLHSTASAQCVNCAARLAAPPRPCYLSCRLFAADRSAHKKCRSKKLFVSSALQSRLQARAVSSEERRLGGRRQRLFTEAVWVLLQPGQRRCSRRFVARRKCHQI